MNRNGNRSSMRIFHPGWSVIVCLLLGTVGCASKGAISGKVLYQGKPLPGGTVTFHLAGKGAFPTPIQEDGSYSLARVPSGEVKIAVETESQNPNQGGIEKEAQIKQRKYIEDMEKKLKETMPEGEERNQLMPPRPPKAKYVRIPAQYNDPEKSGLTYTVIGGTQTHDIELK